MGGVVKTAAHAVATVGTGIAAGATLGQVKSVNKAFVSELKKTGKAAADCEIRHLGETVGTGVGVAATAIAAGATLGQVDKLNNAVKDTSKHFVKTGKKTGKALSEAVDGVPVVGHIKGGIHYACGDSKGGAEAMKSASRTTAVIGGAVAGGPAGAIAGGLAVDLIATGVESIVDNEYKPSGLVANTTNIVKGKNVVENLGGAAATLALDGYVGAKARAQAKPHGKSAMTVEAANIIKNKVNPFGKAKAPVWDMYKDGSIPSRGNGAIVRNLMKNKIKPEKLAWKTVNKICKKRKRDDDDDRNSKRRRN